LTGPSFETVNGKGKTKKQKRKTKRRVLKDEDQEVKGFDKKGTWRKKRKLSTAMFCRGSKAGRDS